MDFNQKNGEEAVDWGDSMDVEHGTDMARQNVVERDSAQHVNEYERSYEVEQVEVRHRHSIRQDDRRSKVTTEYTIDHKETVIHQETHITVQSEWNERRSVDTVKDQVSHSVNQDDLEKASKETLACAPVEKNVSVSTESSEHVTSMLVSETGEQPSDAVGGVQDQLAEHTSRPQDHGTHSDHTWHDQGSTWSASTTQKAEDQSHQDEKAMVSRHASPEERNQSYSKSPMHQSPAQEYVDWSEQPEQKDYERHDTDVKESPNRWGGERERPLSDTYARSQGWNESNSSDERHRHGYRSSRDNASGQDYRRRHEGRDQPSRRFDSTDRHHASSGSYPSSRRPPTTTSYDRSDSERYGQDREYRRPMTVDKRGSSNYYHHRHGSSDYGRPLAAPDQRRFTPYTKRESYHRSTLPPSSSKYDHHFEYNERGRHSVSTRRDEHGYSDRSTYDRTPHTSRYEARHNTYNNRRQVPHWQRNDRDTSRSYHSSQPAAISSSPPPISSSDRRRSLSSPRSYERRYEPEMRDREGADRSPYAQPPLTTSQSHSLPQDTRDVDHRKIQERDTYSHSQGTPATAPIDYKHAEAHHRRQDSPMTGRSQDDNTNQDLDRETTRHHTQSPPKMQPVHERDDHDGQLNQAKSDSGDAATSRRMSSSPSEQIVWQDWSSTSPIAPSSPKKTDPQPVSSQPTVANSNQEDVPEQVSFLGAKHSDRTSPLRTGSREYDQKNGKDGEKQTQQLSDACGNHLQSLSGHNDDSHSSYIPKNADSMQTSFSTPPSSSARSSHHTRTSFTPRQHTSSRSFHATGSAGTRSETTTSTFMSREKRPYDDMQGRSGQETSTGRYHRTFSDRRPSPGSDQPGETGSHRATGYRREHHYNAPQNMTNMEESSRKRFRFERDTTGRPYHDPATRRSGQSHDPTFTVTMGRNNNTSMNDASGHTQGRDSHRWSRTYDDYRGDDGRTRRPFIRGDNSTSRYTHPSARSSHESNSYAKTSSNVSFSTPTDRRDNSQKLTPLQVQRPLMDDRPRRYGQRGHYYRD